MEKLTRNNRVVAITKLLTENPNKIIGLNKFSGLLNAAKSTISEDIVIVRSFTKLNMGKIETIAGAAGGIRYVPGINKEEQGICRKFMWNIKGWKQNNSWKFYLCYRFNVWSNNS